MVLTDSVKNPGYSFSYFRVLVSEHGKEIVEGRNDDAREGLLVWAFGN